MSKRVNNAKGRPSKNKSTGFQYRFLQAERARMIKDAKAGKYVPEVIDNAIRMVSSKLQKLAPKVFKERRRGVR